MAELLAQALDISHKLQKRQRFSPVGLARLLKQRNGVWWNFLAHV